MTHALKYPPRKSLPSPVFALLLLVFGAITVAAADFGAIPLAGGQGHDSTTQNITGLEGRLTREQIAEGKRRAQDWLDRRKKASASQRSLSKWVAQDSGSSETAKENRKYL